MAENMFFKVDGIEGQSTDKAHQNWVDVISFSHGGAQNIQSMQGSSVAGKGKFDPFVIVHASDKASPKFQEACMRGTLIPNAELNVCRIINDAQEVVYKVKLEGLKIISTETKVVPMADGYSQPAEEVQFVANKMTWTQIAIKADGSKDGATEATWNQVEKK